MQKLLVLTDLHIRADGKLTNELDPMARFLSVLEHALAHHGDAEALVIMGDLTHSGRPAEYKRLSEVLDRVHIPILPMLGNLDRRAAFLKAFPQAAVTKSGHVQAILDLDGHRIITLDTLDGPPYPKGQHHGLLGPDRLKWLRKALEDAGNRIPLVFAHHPPMRIGLPFMDEIRLADGREMLALLAAHPGAHLFCGHVHRTISGSVRGVPFTIFKSTCHQAPLDLIATDAPPYVEEPGAYGLLLLSKRGVIVHHQDVGQPDAAPVMGHHATP
jgi:3',5'-cyclic-AMP phosphodiesterase